MVMGRKITVEDLEELLAPSQVAKLADVTVGALKWHEETGRLVPIARVGVMGTGRRGVRLFRRSDVEAWLSARTTRVVPSPNPTSGSPEAA
jgi:hypothetical protein